MKKKFNKLICCFALTSLLLSNLFFVYNNSMSYVYASNDNVEEFWLDLAGLLLTIGGIAASGGSVTIVEGVALALESYNALESGVKLFTDNGDGTITITQSAVQLALEEYQKLTSDGFSDGTIGNMKAGIKTDYNFYYKLQYRTANHLQIQKSCGSIIMNTARFSYLVAGCIRNGTQTFDSNGKEFFTYSFSAQYSKYSSGTGSSIFNTATAQKNKYFGTFEQYRIEDGVRTSYKEYGDYSNNSVSALYSVEPEYKSLSSIGAYGDFPIFSNVDDMEHFLETGNGYEKAINYNPNAVTYNIRRSSSFSYHYKGGNTTIPESKVYNAPKYIEKLIKEYPDENDNDIIFNNFNIWLNDGIDEPLETETETETETQTGTETETETETETQTQTETETETEMQTETETETETETQTQTEIETETETQTGTEIETETETETQTCVASLDLTDTNNWLKKIYIRLGEFKDQVISYFESMNELLRNYIDDGGGTADGETKDYYIKIHSVPNSNLKVNQREFSIETDMENPYYESCLAWYPLNGVSDIQYTGSNTCILTFFNYNKRYNVYCKYNDTGQDIRCTSNTVSVTIGAPDVPSPDDFGIWDGFTDSLNEKLTDIKNSLVDFHDDMNAKFGTLNESVDSLASSFSYFSQSCLGYLKDIKDNIGGNKQLPALPAPDGGDWDILEFLLDIAKNIADNSIDEATQKVGDLISEILTGVSDIFGMLSEVFPFSIPWDIALLIGALSAEPEAPYFEVPFKLDSWGIECTLVLDFEQFEILSTISRAFLSLTWAMYLMNFTVKFTDTKNL